VNQSCVLRGSGLPKTVNIMGRCIIVCSNAAITGLVFLEQGHFETLGLESSLSYTELRTQKIFGFKTTAAAQHNLWWQHHSTQAVHFFYLEEEYDKDTTCTSQIQGLILQYGSRKLPKYALSERIIMSHLFLWI